MMARVKMYSDVEGDAKIGDVVDVSDQRAQELIARGHAIGVAEEEKKEPRPVKKVAKPADD